MRDDETLDDEIFEKMKLIIKLLGVMEEKHKSMEKTITEMEESYEREKNELV